MMRAKLQVRSVERFQNAENVKMSPVFGNKPFGPNGESEDNTFARYTPSGDVSLTITNPDLQGKLNPGDTFYVYFRKAE